MQQPSEKLDCFVRVITPENIEFEYALAGPFQRLPAFLFDVIVRTVAFVGLIFLGGMLLSFLPLGGPLLFVASFIGFFLMSWFYGAFFETRFNGRTLGKMVFKLRAISIDGRPINASQAALRNILRTADMCLLLPLQIFGDEMPPYFGIPTLLIGLITMTCTRRMQRIGDLAAGTMVVSEQGSRFPWNLKPEDTRAFGLSELIPVNFQASASLAQTVGLYMENRKRLSLARRNDVARHLAAPLIQKFGMLSDTSPDLLLCAVYVRTFMSEEQREQGRQQMRLQQVPPQARGLRPIPTPNAPPQAADAAPSTIASVAPSVAAPPAANAIPTIAEPSSALQASESPSSVERPIQAGPAAEAEVNPEAGPTDQPPQDSE